MKSSDSKRIVYETFEGKNRRIPVWFWLSDPFLEARLCDVVGVKARPAAFEHFLYDGGPFQRGPQNFREWEEKLDVDFGVFPSREELIEDTLRQLDDIVGDKWRDKAIAVNLTGPTEYSEYSCSTGQTEEMRSLGQLTHRFDFALLTQLNVKKADKIHRFFFENTLEICKALAEDNRVDICRVADDFCDYNGSIYNPTFTKKIIERQLKIGRAIQNTGKYALLHSDGDISTYMKKLSSGFDGLHPLDLSPKSTLKAALEWGGKLRNARKTLPTITFFTGMPIDLICNKEVSSKDFTTLIEKVIRSIGKRYVVLTSTHNPYPGWSYQDFKDKVKAVKEIVDKY